MKFIVSFVLLTAFRLLRHVYSLRPVRGTKLFRELTIQSPALIRLATWNWQGRFCSAAQN
jgi:hypothetical protein